MCALQICITIIIIKMRITYHLNYIVSTILGYSIRPIPNLIPRVYLVLTTRPWCEKVLSAYNADLVTSKSAPTKFEYYFEETKCFNFVLLYTIMHIL